MQDKCTQGAASVSTQLAYEECHCFSEGQATSLSLLKAALHEDFILMVGVWLNGNFL